jgi:hypothetical protein
MIRLRLAVVLIGSATILAGCSSGYYVNLADVPQQAATRARASAQPVVRHTMRAAAPEEAGEITGSVMRLDATRSDATRPWPKRGTAEFIQIQQDELAREERIKGAMQSVCRGC